MDMVGKGLARRRPARPGWVAREDELHERAIETAGGLDDFGDPVYLEGLRRLLDSYDHEARFHAIGALTAEYQLVELLASRLRAERWWRLRPGYREVPIERPLVITGMVRTGSTALHYLMGANPELQCLAYWLGLHPQPRPPRATWESFHDFQHARAELAMMYASGDNLEAIHHMTAEGPDECGRMMAQSFTDDRFEVVTNMPSYSSWYATTRHTATYRRHKQLVQLVGSYEPAPRWLLKYPVHMRHLDALLDVYPDACVIWTHRDPAAVLYSYVSLCVHFRSLFERNPDPARIAREQLEVWADAMTKGLEMREGREGQFHDVRFGDFMQDPLGTVRAIHERFDEPLGPRAEAALGAWRDANPPGKMGRHDYPTELPGISRAEIHERCADYLARFPEIVEPERAS